MTDYEMISAFSEIWSTAWAVFAVYITVTFAFLVTGYVVAKQLAPKIVRLILILYTVVAIWCFAGVERFARNGVNLGFEIKSSVQLGESGLAWTTMANEPDFMLSAVPILIWAIFLATYAGSVYFFFYQRNSNR